MSIKTTINFQLPDVAYFRNHAEAGAVCEFLTLSTLDGWGTIDYRYLGHDLGAEGSGIGGAYVLFEVPETDVGREQLEEFIKNADVYIDPDFEENPENMVDPRR